jgi:hypothetical protein
MKINSSDINATGVTDGYALVATGNKAQWAAMASGGAGSGSTWTAPVMATSTGSSQAITLPETGLKAQDVVVKINGLIQHTSQYTISGTTLTITANYSGADIEVVKIVGSKGDTGFGVPSGGVMGQYLAKVSGNNYDTAWVTPGNRQLFTNDGITTVGNNSTARASMIPPGLGVSTLTIPANGMPPGSIMRLEGWGIISANMVGPGTFNFYPHYTPQGGSKTDLPGLTTTPLLGAVGICDITLLFQQRSNGILTGGRVRYGVDNSTTQYTLSINPNRTIQASDHTVARTFGVDGQWMIASANNYVTSQMINVTLQNFGYVA